MKLDLEAAHERVRKYLEQYSKTFHEEQNRALDWFIEQQPDARERLEPYRSQIVLILLDETWHLEYEAFFVFSHKCWENTVWGLQEVLTAEVVRFWWIEKQARCTTLAREKMTMILKHFSSSTKMQKINFPTSYE